MIIKQSVLQFNQIHHGKRSGVVILGSGRGQIKKNDIYRNQEAGVYVLYGGNPTIRLVIYLFFFFQSSLLVFLILSK